MAYDFSTLSPADFEDLSRELIGEELGIRFEGFSPGPDRGIDGRHAQAGIRTILQAKHFVGSRFASLKTAMKRERASIKKLSPRRYLLATSCRFTPTSKGQLAELLRPYVTKQSDIFGPPDLNTLLRKFPRIEKAHIKLWLSSSAVLERVIRSAAYTYTAMSRAEIEAKVRVYAQNPSFKEARDKLEASHVLIISGPPGVGKTTLAEMLSYAYVGEEWEFVAIRGLEDGFAAIVDAKKQIFFFDDFLGKVALDARALASKDSELAKFIRRIWNTSNARFILTTRAYIFEEARRVSEYLGDRKLDITKYVLDVGVYTRRIKARILYNHLYVSKISRDHVQNLLNTGALARIVDHKNYNPRIIEWMTDLLRIERTPAEKYAEAFLAVLDNPTQIWDTAFRTHIPDKCRHLLFCLFFCSEYGVSRSELRAIFESLHPLLSKKFGLAYAHDDFTEATKILEGSFIAIFGSQISFINPSVRDYLTEYLKDDSLLADFAPAAKSGKWARALWRHYLSLAGTSDRARFASLFEPLAYGLKDIPIWQPSEDDPSVLHNVDISISERLKLILEWWDASNNSAFEIAALELVGEQEMSFTAWYDGENLVELIVDMKERSGFPGAERFCADLEAILIRILDGDIPPDNLPEICDAVHYAEFNLSGDVLEATSRAIKHQIDDAAAIVSEVDSESTLDDHIEVLRRLAERVALTSDRIEAAIAAVEGRIAEIKERESEAEEPSFTGATLRGREKFDDDDLTGLFASLLEPR